jgi:hypothetical protein
MSVNICQQPLEQQEAIERDKQAAFWANQIKHRKTTRHKVFAEIQATGDLEVIDHLITRVRHYLQIMGVNTKSVNTSPGKAKRPQRHRVAVRGNRPEIAGSRKAGSSDGLWSTPIN